MAPSGLWTAYLWLAVVLFGVSAVVRPIVYFARPGLLSLYDAFVPLLGIPVVAALWGYTHDQPLLWPWVWQVLFVVIVVENVRFFFRPQFRETIVRLGRSKTWLIYGGLELLSLPAFVAVAIYAFGRQGLWK